MAHRIAALILILGAGSATAQELPSAVCDLVIHEEQIELEDAQLAVSVARSDFSAYERILAMIEELWEGDAIDRMSYIEAKYDRDAARLALEQADLILERQSVLVEQYRLVCKSGGEARAFREAYLRYRKADCASLAKAVGGRRHQPGIQPGVPEEHPRPAQGKRGDQAAGDPRRTRRRAGGEAPRRCEAKVDGVPSESVQAGRRIRAIIRATGPHQFANPGWPIDSAALVERRSAPCTSRSSISSSRS